MRKYYTLPFFLIIVLSTYAKTIPSKSVFLKSSNEAFENHATESYNFIDETYAHSLTNYVSLNSTFNIVSCPSDIVVDNDPGVCYAQVNFTTPTTDNTLLYYIARADASGLNSGDNFPIGTTTIIFEERTIAGDILMNTCSFDITVNDTEAPVFTSCPGNLVRGTNPCAWLSGAATNPSSSDNCGVVLQTWTMTGATVDSSPSSGINVTQGETFNLGTTTVTYYIEDASGNSANCSFTVTVVDDDAPTASCQNISVPLDSSGNATITPAQIDNGSSDFCGSVSLSLSQTNFDCSDIGNNTVTLTVTDGNGNTDTCSATVTITDIVFNPSVLISASSTTICQGDSVTFTATPTDGGSNPAYQWYINGVVQGGETGSTFTTSTLSNSDSVTVTMVSDLSACATAVTSNAINMTVNPIRNVSFNINASTTTICTGESITFNHGPITNGGANPDFEWFVNGSSVATTETFTTNSLSNNDVVTLEVTSYVSCATPTPAISNNSITITVNPLPSLSTSNGNVCANNQTSIDLNTLVTTDGTNVTFHSSQANADNDTGAISSTVSPTSNTTYYVRSEFATGCYVTDTILIIVDPLPNVIANASATTICFGDSITLTGSGASSYTWDNGVTDGVSFSPSSTQTYTVTGSDANGCYNTDSITITVNPLPTLSVSDGSVCASGQTSIDLNTLVTTNGTSVTFHSNQSNADNDTGTISATVSPGSTTTYYVRSESATGCYITDSITITIDALPTLSTTNGEVCLGQSNYDLNSSVTTNGTTVTFHTSQTDANNDTGAISASVSPASNTTYYVRSENSAGCYTTDTIDITVNALPNVNANASATTICIGDSVTLTGTGASSYSWDNGVTDGLSFSPSSTQTYTVTGTDANGCYNTDSITITVNPNATLSLNGSNNNQDICINSSITDIVYTVGGGASGATVTGLPAGLSGSYSAGTFTISGTATVSGIFNYTVSTQGCGLDTATGTIHVFSGVPAQPSIINGDTALCPPITGLIYSVTDNPDITYTWTVPSGFIITSGQGTNEITVNTTATSNDGDVTVTATNPCGTSTASTLSLSVGNFAYADAGPDQVVCEGTNQITLAGTVGGVINGANKWDWDDNGAGGSINSPNSLNSTYTLPSGTTAGDVITISIITAEPRGSCTGVTDNMTITVIANPTASISGDTTLCEGGTSDITFTATPNTTVTYTIDGGSNQTINIDGGGTATLSTGALSSNTTYNLVSVEYNSTPNCVSSVSGSATITVNPAATVDAGTNQTICEGSTVSLSGSFGGGATSASWSSPIGGSFDNPNNANAIYTPTATDISNGSVVLTYTTNDPSGPCPAVSDTVTITINPIPAINAGVDQSICEGSTVTLAGSFGGGATSATWSSPTGGSFNNPNNTNAIYTPSATDISNGSVVLTYTTNDPAGPCNAVSDTVTININPAATVYAGTNQTICEGSTVTLSGSFGDGASSATWSSPTGGSFDNPSNTNAIYTPTATDISNGSVVLTYETNDPAGPCNAVSDTVTININPAAIANAGVDQTICEGSTVSLSGSFGGGASSATWSSATGGSFNNPNNANAIYTPSAADISNGSVVLTYTTNDPAGPCNADSDDITITINPIAVVDAGTNQTVCSNGSINLNGSVTGGASSGTWSAPSGSFGNPNQLNTTYSPTIASGTVILTLTSADPDGSGPCAQLTDTVTITVKEEVIITTQPENVGVCVTNPASLSVVAYGEDLTYQWYYGSAPGTPVSNGGNISGATSSTLNFSQTYLSDAGTYYVVVSGDSSCSSVTSDEITLNVNQIMNITSQPVSQTLCEGSTVTFNISATGSISGYQWYKENGATDITLSNGGDISGATTDQLQITNIDPSDAGQYYVVLSGPGGTCPSATSSLATLNVTQIPTATISYSGTPYCDSVSGTQPVTISGTHAYTGGTYSASPSGLTLNSSTGSITPSTSSAGTYTVTYTIPASGGCGVETATTSVTITAVPTATISYPNNSYCETDSTTAVVTLNGTNAYTGGTYTASPSGLSINASNGNVNPSTSSVGTYTITYTIPASGGCPSEIATTSLTITPLPVATFDYSNTSYCASDSDPSPVFSGGGTAGNFSASPGGLSINPSTGVIDLDASTSGTYTVTNMHPAANGCITVTDTATITIDDLVVGGDVTGTAIGPDGTLTTSNVILVCQSTGGTLELAGYTGTIVHWESSTDNGVTWTVINNTTDTLSYSTITDTTLYRVRIESGSCGFIYSSVAIISVVPNDLHPSPVTVSDYVLCLGDSSTFTAESSIANGQFETGGQFNTGQLNTNDPDGWLVDGSMGGWTANGDNSNPPHNWSGTNNHYNNNGCVGQIDSDDFKFAIADGIITTTLETPIFNTFGLESTTFEFDYFWYLPDAADQFLIEVSVDGGVTYESIPLLDITGPSTPAINSDPFTDNHMVIDLADYPGVNLIGISNVRIKLTYVGNDVCSGVYLDNIELPQPPIDDVLVWSDAGGNPISYTNNITVTPPAPGVHNYAVTSYLVSNCGYEVTEDNSEFIELIVYDSDIADAGPDINIPLSDCGTNVVTLNAAELTAITPVPDPNDPNNTINLVSTGTWSVTSGQLSSTYSFSDVNDPNSTFTGVPGETYTLEWLVEGPTGSPCPDSTDTMTVSLSACSTLDFDGVDDNVTFRNHYDFSGSFTIEVWVKSEATTGSIQTIYSKRNGTNITGNGGYDLRLVNNLLSFRWNGSTLTASNPIATDRWYHTAVTFNGSTYRLYVDGILVGTAAGSAPNNNNYEFLLGAMDQAAAGGNPNPVNYFNGWMDEMRIWNVALNERQVRHMMNQEIQNNGGNVRGAIVPIDIPGLTWNNLTAYYRMNQGTDISGGYLIPTGGSGAFDGQLRNITTWQEETAPLPYLTRSNGDWNDTSGATPWLYGDSVWDYPNSTGINGDSIDWNIVRVSHNVISQTQDVTVLGLLVDATRELTVTAPGTQDENNSGHGLWVTHYLDLDGFIDLVGESQLVQKRYTSSQVNGSILDTNSSGYIERDQQGTTNLFNYNYWSSPVSAINPTTNNSPYTIDNVLRDGTNSANPINIGWVSGHNASGGTNPIGVSRRWIYAYYNAQSNNYSEWDYIAETATLASGLGFTMKGSGVGDPVADVQNYVFTGKPHNSSISNLVSTGNSLLVGNPYPSAIDSQTFINENGPSGTNSITGTLYFWDHYHSSNTHVLAAYEGGYAQLNLVGGNAAVTPPATVDGYVIIGGTGTRIPGRYVPVSQGFFVSGSGSGGQVTFTNNQRVFQRETTNNSYNGSQFFRMSGINSESKANEDKIKRIRFDFTSQANSVRHLLLGFTPNNEASDGVDYGYDAPNFDNFPSDLSFDIDNGEYVIQGVGQFDETKAYPLIMELSEAGNIEIKVTELENFDEAINVYLYDELLGTYTLINNDNSYTPYLEAGIYNNRFFITFIENNTLDVEEQELSKIQVNYLNQSDEIYIKTPVDVTVKQVYLINILGQTVKAWNYTNHPFSNEFRLPVSNVAQGNYIIKVETDTNNSISKKIVVK